VRVVINCAAWGAVVNSKWFSAGAVLLFLNKRDRFRAKLLCHPEYLDAVGGCHPASAAPPVVPAPDKMYYEHVVEWAKGRFLRMDRARSRRLPVLHVCDRHAAH
jgi:hypothetical protein